MQAELLREKHVRQLVPVAHSTLWAWVKHQKFPSPVKLSERVTVWRREDVENWIAAKGAD
jgi:predicted DNA-binding transcriptional regulator AlpA